MARNPRSASVDLIFHAVTLSFKDDRFGVVEEPIQHGTGESGVVVEKLGLGQLL